MSAIDISKYMNAVREIHPLVHCITNYVTVNDCANAVLAVGASPIMSDEPDDVADIQKICNALVLNIGTLNKQTIRGMEVAGAAAAETGHPIVLDPVGAGASKLRTETAGTLLDTLPVTVVRGNMSEVKALAGAAAATQGVDVNPEDAVTEENLVESARFVADLAAKANCVIAVTGAIDVITDGQRAFAVRNGSPLMGSITGAGCMLTCVVAAFVAASKAAFPEAPFVESVTSAIAFEGVCGQIAAGRLQGLDGTGSFRTYLIDAFSKDWSNEISEAAKVEEVAL